MSKCRKLIASATTCTPPPPKKSTQFVENRNNYTLTLTVKLQRERQCHQAQWLGQVSVVRVLALRSGDPGLKTCSDHLLNLILVVPGSTSQLH